MLAFVPAEKGSARSAFRSPSSLPVTCQPFNVECQGDGDVTLPAGWRPLGPTRVQRQERRCQTALHLGLACRGFRAPTLSTVVGTPRRNSGGPSQPTGVPERLAPTSASICTRSPPKSRPLDSRTRLDASPPSDLGRWARSHASKDS